jgi:hypothetical protein
MIFSDLICLLRSVRKNDFFVGLVRIAQEIFFSVRQFIKKHTHICVCICV